MDFNKITADLSFVSSSVHNIVVKADGAQIPDSEKKGFGLDIKCSEPFVKDNEKFGKLLMQVEVTLFKKNEELEPDTFKIVIEGIFKATNEMSNEKFLELLNINGGAALFSIARSKIEMLSSMTYAEGKIVIPMINIIQYFSERNISK